MSKVRADSLLAERGLAASRSAAAESIRAGRVRLRRGGEVVDKPGRMLPEDVELDLLEPQPYVSRGGAKLANALDALGISVEGRSCLDIGASTGGFTDCLLQRGAERVIALDVGHGQLDWRLRQDPRVEVIERFNARELERERLPYAPDLVTVDVSFISLALLMPAIARSAADHFELLGLVKPQFELGRDRVGRGGVVREPEARLEALRRVAEAASATGLAVRGFAGSGLPGPKGNIETFIWCDRSRGEPVDVEAALREVEP